MSMVRTAGDRGSGFESRRGSGGLKANLANTQKKVSISALAEVAAGGAGGVEEEAEEAMKEQSRTATMTMVTCG